MTELLLEFGPINNDLFLGLVHASSEKGGFQLL